jgi:hypothetical protein
MSYFGFMGMNGPSGYGNYVGNTSSSPSGGVNQAQSGGPALSSATAENKTGADRQKIKKTGISGFFQGMKNGLVNTVKSLFTIKGMLITIATLGLVAATGGAALLPLALMGLGVGGYQVSKGVIKGDTEEIGEGAFTLGASLLGAKISPASVGANTLADSTLLGKLKAPFGGKGTFSNSNATFFGASKEVTSDTVAGIRAKFNARTKGSNISESKAASPAGAMQNQDSFTPQQPLAHTADSVSKVNAQAGDTQAQPGYSQRIGNWMNALRNKLTPQKVRDFFVPNPVGNGNTQSPPSSGAATPINLGQRAQTYLQEVKKSPQTVSNWLGTIFGGSGQTAKKQAKGFTEGGTIYY